MSSHFRRSSLHDQFAVGPFGAFPGRLQVPFPPAKFAGAKRGRRDARKRWWMAWLYPDGLCSYCGERLVEATRDHVEPKVQGGPDRLDNQVPSCKLCNNEKDRQSLLMFLWLRAAPCS